MNIKIITFGKLKNREIESLIDYYQKLTSKYAKVKLVTLKDNERQVTEEDLVKHLNTRSFLIALGERGKEFTTEEFSSYLTKLQLNYSEIIFVIGNAYGIDPSLLSKADLSLSFGKFTYPHEFMQVLLLEQLFRSYNLAAGGKYHK